MHFFLRTSHTLVNLGPLCDYVNLEILYDFINNRQLDGFTTIPTKDQPKNKGNKT